MKHRRFTSDHFVEDMAQWKDNIGRSTLGARGSSILEQQRRRGGERSAKSALRVVVVLALLLAVCLALLFTLPDDTAEAANVEAMSDYASEYAWQGEGGGGGEDWDGQAGRKGLIGGISTPGSVLRRGNVGDGAGGSGALDQRRELHVWSAMLKEVLGHLEQHPPTLPNPIVGRSERAQADRDMLAFLHVPKTGGQNLAPVIALAFSSYSSERNRIGPHNRLDLNFAASSKLRLLGNSPDLSLSLLPSSSRKQSLKGETRKISGDADDVGEHVEGVGHEYGEEDQAEDEDEANEKAAEVEDETEDVGEGGDPFQRYFERLDLLYGHFDVSVVWRFARSRRRVLPISMLRDPESRVLSMYNFLMSNTLTVHTCLHLRQTGHLKITREDIPRLVKAIPANAAKENDLHDGKEEEEHDTNNKVGKQDEEENNEQEEEEEVAEESAEEKIWKRVLKSDPLLDEEGNQISPPSLTTWEAHRFSVLADDETASAAAGKGVFDIIDVDLLNKTMVKNLCFAKFIANRMLSYKSPHRYHIAQMKKLEKAVNAARLSPYFLPITSSVENLLSYLRRAHLDNYATRAFTGTTHFPVVGRHFGLFASYWQKEVRQLLKKAAAKTSHRQPEDDIGIESQGTQEVLANPFLATVSESVHRKAAWEAVVSRAGQGQAGAYNSGGGVYVPQAKGLKGLERRGSFYPFVTDSSSDWSLKSGSNVSGPDLTDTKLSNELSQERSSLRGGVTPGPNSGVGRTQSQQEHEEKAERKRRRRGVAKLQLPRGAAAAAATPGTGEEEARVDRGRGLLHQTPGLPSASSTEGQAGSKRKLMTTSVRFQGSARDSQLLQRVDSEHERTLQGLDDKVEAGGAGETEHLQGVRAGRVLLGVAERILDRLAWLGLTERYDESVDLFLATFCLQNYAQKANSTAHRESNKSKKKILDLSGGVGGVDDGYDDFEASRIEAAIRDSEWMDIELYEHAKLLFEARASDLQRRREHLRMAGLPSGKGVDLPDCPELPFYALNAPARKRRSPP